jgi:hypothetical protein
MSEERFEQGQREDETEDVEGHKKAKALTDEPRSEEESDEVEAHAKKNKHVEI